jgi:sugar phosphate isomerase/epimerase
MPDTTHPSLYERDFYSWTREQAARLRHLRGVDAIDTEIIAEEIEDLGRERRDAGESNMERFLEHLIKLAVSPGEAPRGTWRREARAFAKHARRKFSPGMRQHLDLHTAWSDAVEMARDELSDYGETLPQPQSACPLSLDEILDAKLDLDRAIPRVAGVFGLAAPSP